ncbi:MAG: NAD(P)H-binding protein [Halioglobus sp.]
MKQIAVCLAVLLISACSSTPSQPESQAEQITHSEKAVTVALLGSTGMTGGFILQDLLTHGYKVRALARSPQKLDAMRNQITIVKGDATNPEAIRELLMGSDIIVSAIGPVKGDGLIAKTISTRTTKNIIDTMSTFSIERYIVVSGAAVTVPGDNRNMTGWLVQKSATLALRDTVKDKQAEYKLLAASEINWTLLRCPVISAEPFKEPAIESLASPSAFSLRAGELSRFIVELVASGNFSRQAPFLNSR